MKSARDRQCLGIANLDAGSFRDRILRFEESYVEDWQSWIRNLQSQQDVAGSFGRVVAGLPTQSDAAYETGCKA